MKNQYNKTSDHVIKLDPKNKVLAVLDFRKKSRHEW